MGVHSDFADTRQNGPGHFVGERFIVAQGGRRSGLGENARAEAPQDDEPGWAAKSHEYLIGNFDSDVASQPKKSGSTTKIAVLTLDPAQMTVGKLRTGG